MLLTEDLAARLLYPVLWAGLFAVLYLFDIHGFTGIWGTLILAICFYTGLFILLKRAFKGFRLPSADQTDRRLETESNIMHRPLSSLRDKNSLPEQSESRHLWQKAQLRFQKDIKHLKIPMPRSAVSGKDPFALRYVVAVALMIGIFVTGQNSLTQVKSGFAPALPLPSFSLADKISGQIQVDITPPAYTGIAPIKLQSSVISADDDPLKIIDGSQMKLQVFGGFFTPYVIQNGEKKALIKTTKNIWTYGTELTRANSGFVKIRQGLKTRDLMNINVIEDIPPTVSWGDEKDNKDNKANTTKDGFLNLPVKTQDDFGVKSLYLSVDIDPDHKNTPSLYQPYQNERIVRTAPQTETELTMTYDLAWHPWAGLPVLASITAMDDLGQTSQTQQIKITLPEKSFLDPVAKKFVALRKTLLEDGITNKAIQSKSDIIEHTEYVILRPHLYRGDISIFMTLNSLRLRLAHAGKVFDNKDVRVDAIEILWDIAVRLEDGNLPAAVDNFQNAAEKLRKTLENPDATDADIADAVNNLQQAMAAYFQEMAKTMQQRIQSENMPNMDYQQAMQNRTNLNALAEFLERLQSKAFSGDKAEAQTMLGQLDRFMQNMQSIQNTVPSKEMQQAMQDMKDIQDLIAQQSALMQETLPIANKSPQDIGKELTPIKKAQEDLKNKTQKMAEKSQQSSEPMNAAKTAMEEAIAAMDEYDTNMAVYHQQEAIRHLQSALNSTSQSLQKMMQGMTLFSLGGPSGSVRYDPFGRPYQQSNGNQNGLFHDESDVNVPDQATQNRIRDILDALRKKSGEFERPEEERDYYKRLIQPF